jgi:hypothetical protein
MPNHIHTIEQVLTELDLIIQECVEENNFLAVFAYVYRRTTAKIKEGIEQERFQDNKALEEFDVIFARLFIDAYNDYKADKSIRACWKFAFDNRYFRTTIMQHLLLGMNAHINVDLAQAADIVNGDRDIGWLKHDFMLVNDLLEELIEEMQERIRRASPLFFLFDWAGGRTDEQIANFSMRKARFASWLVAQKLAALKAPEAKKACMEEVDRFATKLSQKILRPGGRFLPILISLITVFEKKKMDKINASLSG